MPEELNMFPCPLCKGKAVFIAKQINNLGRVSVIWSVECTKCGLPTNGYRTQRQALEAWNSLPRMLVWTKEAPTEPGWYWCRYYGKCIHIVNVGVDLSEYQKISDVEWAGPIPELREHN